MIKVLAWSQELDAAGRDTPQARQAAVTYLVVSQCVLHRSVALGQPKT